MESGGQKRAIPAVDTLTETLPKLVGVEKPVGTFTVIIAPPETLGRNPLNALADPAGIVTVGTVIVPKPAGTVATLTLTGGTPVIAATG